MGKIDYKAIYDKNKHGWYDMTEEPQKYEALLAGHYSDSNHFVYELLQNAEDARASRVFIEYYQDKLVFYHDGDPFNEKDVYGVSSMLMGTKDKEDAQTIGRFGMGFKSVFKYTYQPEIYSDEEAFQITRYLLPVEIEDGWDYKRESVNIACKLGNGRTLLPFIKSEHLTKIVIPFKKYGKDGTLQPVSGDDVLKKLEGLNGEILLFLTHIRSLCWVNRMSGSFAQITMAEDATDAQLFTCRIEGTAYGDREEISRYLKFKKVFDHKDMRNAEVSVAYRLNSRADNINEVNDAPIWVYFPTRDDTDLPFLIHGSFETAVSREKLMSPSEFNSDLFDALGDLIAMSMVDLARRKLITQGFLRRCLMKAFTDEKENQTIPGLKEKVTQTIAELGLLPDREGNYRKPSELRVPAPFKMGDFKDRPVIGEIFKDVETFVAFNNEQEANFGQYYSWLVDDLRIRVYSMVNMARDIRNIPENYKFSNTCEAMSALEDFYEFLWDNRESMHTTGLSFNRSAAYVQGIRQNIASAWNELRKAPIVLNRLNQLVPAESDGKPNVYLAASSEYKSVMQAALVNTSIATKYRKLLAEGFHVAEFNNFQYVKEKVIQKYYHNPDVTISFENLENYEEEYLEDLRQILALIEQSGDVTEIRTLLKDAYIVKAKAEEGVSEPMFCKPGSCYVPTSTEGIDLCLFYENTPYRGRKYGCYQEDNQLKQRVRVVDRDFYEQHGIALSKLSKLGLITTPVDEGIKQQNGYGDEYWFAVGEFCPDISIAGLEDNLCFIEDFPESDLAKKKSAQLFKLLIGITEKLQGQRRKRQRNPYLSDIEWTYVLCRVKSATWLYSKNLILDKPGNLSCYDLNTALYGPVQTDKKPYEILGFVEKNIDVAEETLQNALHLTRQDKMRLLTWLAKDLGKEVADSISKDDWDEEDSSQVFNPNEWADEAFPVKRVNNLDYLSRHVQEQFFCADPIRYKKVLRQIRVSKDHKADRSYVIGMYTNDSNAIICQMCKKSLAYAEAAQIANFGIEMPQLNLCLCRECAAKYSAVRDANRDEFKRGMREAIMAIDVMEPAEDYAIKLNAEDELHFTQTHIAELREIFRMIAEYGLPCRDEENDDDAPTGYAVKTTISAVDSDPANLENGTVHVDVVENLPSDVAVPGRFVSYKKKFGDYDMVDTVLDLQYPLHKVLLGHKVGDIISFQGRSYEIIGL